MLNLQFVRYIQQRLGNDIHWANTYDTDCIKILTLCLTETGNVQTTLSLSNVSLSSTGRTYCTQVFVVVSIIMAARQLAGRRPLYFDVSILFIFFRRLISEVSGPIVTKFCHMFGGDCDL